MRALLNMPVWLVLDVHVDGSVRAGVLTSVPLIRNESRVGAFAGDRVMLREYADLLAMANRLTNEQLRRHVRARTIESVQLRRDYAWCAFRDSLKELRWHSFVSHGISLETATSAGLSGEVHFLCLLKCRIAPQLPADAWHAVISAVLTVNEELCVTRFYYQPGARRPIVWASPVVRADHAGKTDPNVELQLELHLQAVRTDFLRSGHG